ncbi:MAG: glycosyltransferase family 39 protein [Candidatus Eisenbacteria bacterium]
MSSRRRLGIALILIVAIVLRVLGIRYGLPSLFYFHDEPQVVLRALRFGTGDLNPHFFGWPAILLFEVAFVSFIALFIWGRLAGWWKDAAGFAAGYFKDPTAFYVLARMQSVLSGVWTVWIAEQLGRAAYSPTVGLAAAVGMTVSALHVHYSHLAHPVIVLTAFMSLGLWACCKLAVDGDARDFQVFALALGLGSAAQYHAMLLIAPLSVAMMLRVRAEPGGAGRWIGGASLAVFGGIAIHLLLSPYTLLDHHQFLHDLNYEATKASGGSAGPRPPLAAISAFVIDALMPSLTLPVLMLAGIGSLAALWRRRPADLVLLSFVLSYFLVMSRSGIVNDRYGLPLVLPGLLFAARWLEDVFATVPHIARQRWLVPVSIFMISLPSAARSLETDLTMIRGDTRIDALHWFEQNVPTNARVVVDMHRFRNTASPPLAENAVRLRERLEEIRRGDMVVSGSSRAYEPYYRYQLEHPHPIAYYLRSTDMGGAMRPLDSYRADGFEWAVTSDLARTIHERSARSGDSLGIRYYLELDRDAELAAEFRPRRWTRMGPVIRVYRLTRKL